MAGTVGGREWHVGCRNAKLSMTQATAGNVANVGSSVAMQSVAFTAA
jgi:hypothetical protein